MKNKGKCPKCEKTNILFIPGSIGAYGTGNNIMVGISIFSAVPVNRYICKNCGFSEEWIDVSDMGKIVQKHEN